MNPRKYFNIVLVIAAIALLPFTVQAASEDSDSQENQRNGDSQGKGRPPKEAIQACEGKQVGDSVTFAGRHGDTVKATCKEIQGQLVAFPEGGPPPPKEDNRE